jgi:hypothetical protein
MHEHFRQSRGCSEVQMYQVPPPLVPFRRPDDIGGWSLGRPAGVAAPFQPAPRLLQTLASLGPSDWLAMTIQLPLFHLSESAIKSLSTSRASSSNRQGGHLVIYEGEARGTGPSVPEPVRSRGGARTGTRPPSTVDLPWIACPSPAIQITAFSPQPGRCFRSGGLPQIPGEVGHLAGLPGDTSQPHQPDRYPERSSRTAISRPTRSSRAACPGSIFPA